MSGLYTFILRYGDEFGDEIDVEASSSEEARRLATLVATDMYAAGWTELRAIAPGGSGGLVLFL